ncbi:TPA: hypothetical protein ACXZLZ_004168 [Salmonella enterica]
MGAMEFSNKKKLITSMIGTGVLFLFLSGYLLFRTTTPPVNCHGDFREYVGDGRLIATVHFALNGGMGSVVLKGRVIYPNGNEYPFYIRKYTSYQLRRDVLVLTRTEQPLFTAGNTDVQMLRGYLHEFFIESSPPQFTARMYRLVERNDAWIISSSGKVPFLLCADH